jgi:hypothetical protein
MCYEDRIDVIMFDEIYDYNQVNDYNDYNQVNDYNDYNDIEFRDIVIINNEIKDMFDLHDIIDSFKNMHI